MVSKEDDEEDEEEEEEDSSNESEDGNGRDDEAVEHHKSVNRCNTVYNLTCLSTHLLCNPRAYRQASAQQVQNGIVGHIPCSVFPWEAPTGTRYWVGNTMKTRLGGIQCEVEDLVFACPKN